jgi:diadenosine tetraphosphate (Ap4A) HIT family hydrolase
MTSTRCHSCDREAELDRLPPRELIAADEHWRVVHAYDTALPGWLVLITRRHVAEVAELTDDEAASLGAWQVRLARVLAAELGAAKTYVAEFGEAPGFHLHFHVVARPPDLPTAMIGPNVFSLLGSPESDQVTAADRDALATKLAARLTT